MPTTTTAVATTKGFRGVAQDFLAPELRALSERIQGFENLNKERFNNVDRQFVDVNRRIDELKESMDRQFVDVNRRIDELKESMDRQFGDVNRRIDELKESSERRFDSIDRKQEAMAKDIADLPQAIATSIDRLIHEMNVSNRLALLERQNASTTDLHGM
jgi:predicted  nucleic acid-binding Zn-ribbon protein